MWRKGTLLHCLWVCKLIQSPWKTVWRFLRKLKVEPYDPAFPLLGSAPVFIAVLFTTAWTWKPPRCPLTDK